MSDLPPGWEWTTLGEVLERIETGKSFAGEGRPASPSEWGVIKVSAMTYGSFRENENKAVRAETAFSEAAEIKPGDLLLSRANTRDYVGASVQVGNCRPRLLLSDKSLRLVPTEVVNRRWLWYALSSPTARQYMSNASSGVKAGMRNISQDSLRSMPLTVPPLEEQRRIVDTLEDHLSRISAAEVALTLAEQRLGVLSHVMIDGLFSEVEPVELRPLATLLREPLRNGYSGRASEAGQGVRTLTLTAVTKKEFSVHHTKVAEITGRSIDDLWLEPGDIFVQRSNTPELVGTSALYTGARNWAIFPDLLIRVRTNSEVSPDYTYLALSSQRVRRELRTAAKGLAGSMPKIDQGTIERTQIPVPSRAAQDRIVERARSLQAETDRLAANLTMAQKRGKLLRHSMLGDAFAGRLVKQDSDDEPASVLLERIRAGRTAQPKVKRGRLSTKSESGQGSLL